MSHRLISVSRLTQSFRFHEYRQYWTGSNVAMLAFNMNDVILGWLILQATDSAFLVGLAAFARGLPLLIWSPFTGVWADRMRRQSLMAVALGLASLASVGLALLIWRDLADPWHMILTAFIVGSAFSLYAPARLALLPSLVPVCVFLSASTVEYSSTRVIGFVGPILAGLLVDHSGAPWSLVLQTGFFLLAALVFSHTGGKDRDSESPVHERTSFRLSILESLSYLRQDRPLRMLFLLGLIIVPIGITYQKLMPVFAREFGGSASTLGLMLGLTSLGTALAGFVLAAIGDTFSKGRALTLAAALFGASLIALALFQQIWLVYLLLFFLGVVAGVFLTLSNVLFQSRPPAALRGRVMGGWGMVWGLLPFTSLAAGAVAEQWHVSLAIAASGAVCLAFAAGMALIGSPVQEL